ncbi:hypothetical protein I0Q91_10490 [Halanaerobiaceae bacterium Z-7014]|uniref:Uncharacterized protein n=1 Tax=Halonatronomonas betaini TaxID=2778430 RepID=A0A931ATA7_9FIRM|nr:hypothetical protein [Halonatronomonas betaini]MBF8437511.1 hypothetical protein [Halonatronomonas betaini]
MNKNNKKLTLMILLLSFIFIISACSPDRTSFQYDLSLQVAGEGEIRDSAGRTLISSENSTILDRRVLRVDRNSTVRLNAFPDEDNNYDFLFWAGNIGEFDRANNRVYMSSDKDLIAVFGDENVFMSGYITQSNRTTDVTGFWKAFAEPDSLANPNLEIYLNQRNNSQDSYRYINDQDSEESLMRAIPDGRGSQFIAAAEKLEKSDMIFGDEATRIIFVYAYIGGFEAFVVSEEHPDWIDINDEFLEIIQLTGEENEEEFISRVDNIIDEYYDDDIIKGQTFILPAD